MSRNCFAPGCDTGYRTAIARNKALGKKNPSLFCAPKEVELLEKWRRAIPRKDKVFMHPSRLCELHFDDECIIRTYETKLADGTISVIPRERPLLNPGSVPSRFPNLPKYLSFETPKRKAPPPRPTDNKRMLKSAENEMPIDDQYSDNLLFSSDINKIEKPNKWWTVCSDIDYIVCFKLDMDLHCERHVVVSRDYSVKIFLRNKEIVTDETKIESNQNLSLLLNKVDKLIICNSLESCRKLYKCCLGFFSGCPQQNNLCSGCTEFELKNNKEQKRIQKLSTKKFRLALQKKYTMRKNARLVKKVSVLKEELKNAWTECKNIKDDVLESAISSLPQEQQTAIKTCVAAAKLKNKKSMRYSIHWIYECLLLRIKSRKAYDHLRQHNILTLPSSKTLLKYIHEIKGTYGFHQSTFICLQKKADFMDASDRRGVILIDEMKIEKAVNFNQNDCKIYGFTDLGQFTPELHKHQLGDHVLVFMFQPFKGRWVQALGCFLSKGAASGTVLHHLIIECIALVEKSSYFVDAIVTDGASWNRNMWHHFGITDQNVSCPHVSNDSRKLWFISDFPHLIKNVRNSISANRQMMTHKGLIDTKFWEAVLEMDNPRGFNLKACPKLTMDTIYPQNFQKMNVPMAFQFFSTSVSSAMELYRSEHLALENSQSCVDILKLFNSGIRAMNSRTPLDSLHLNSSEEKAIKVLLEFIIDWEKFAKEHNLKFLSDSTCFGLKVTLKATIEILSFLHNDCGFTYLMTSRLNQDSLERFFGMMRSACGSNDHPDSKAFLQLYRLLSTYSLVKPPKGSCIASTEIFGTLLTINDVKEEATARKMKLSNLLDNIIDQGSTEELLPVVIEMIEDHNYDMLTSSDFVISYVSGYIIRRTSKFTTCDICLQTLTTSDHNEQDSNKFIQLKSRGYLLYPSKSVTNLITSLENTILKTVRENKIHSELLYNIMEKLYEGQNLILVGCNEHKYIISEKIVQFYLVTRLHFICKQLNKNEKSTKTKKFRKFAKL